MISVLPNIKAIVWNSAEGYAMHNVLDAVVARLREFMDDVWDRGVLPVRRAIEVEINNEGDY